MVFCWLTALQSSFDINTQNKYRSLGKIRHEKIRQMPHTTKIKHTKIFLPLRNRVVYNGL